MQLEGPRRRARQLIRLALYASSLRINRHGLRGLCGFAGLWSCRPAPPLNGSELGISALAHAPLCRTGLTGKAVGKDR